MYPRHGMAADYPGCDWIQLPTPPGPVGAVGRGEPVVNRPRAAAGGEVKAI